MTIRLHRLVVTATMSLITILALLSASDTSNRVWAQTPASPAKDQLQANLEQVKAALAENQKALRQYTWTETTEVSLKGEVKSQKQNSCVYAPDGKVVKTLTLAPPEKKKARGIKGKIVDKKVAELTAYMERAQSLVSRYVPPDPAKMQASLKAEKGELRIGAGGKSTLVFRDYAKQGDEFALMFDTAAKKILSINVKSYLDDPKDDIVTLVTTFTSLPEGPNYLSESVLNADAKEVQVKVTNSAYHKLAK